jgi:uncharacterized integral membrane protein (TIGR00698 family)
VCFAAKLKSVNKNVFFVGLILAASGLLPPPLGLAAGLVYGFTFVHPYHLGARRLSKFLLQASVVGLGFEVAKVGRSGFLYTACSISAAMLIGLAIGRGLQVGRTSSFLITAGTAICGGSAIAAVGPITNATDEEMAVSLGTVFVLNSIGLLLFPALGWALHLTQTQFGLWSALAIHDTSSVVGATAKYGAVALTVGITVKLARALWIVPVSVLISILKRSKSSIHWPWFIGLFCLAAMANTYFPSFGFAYPALSHLGRLGLTVTLYLIGTGLSKSTLQEVGIRPLLQGVLLWAIVAMGSLMLILQGWIRV